jgi:hypothetical protein
MTLKAREIVRVLADFVTKLEGMLDDDEEDNDAGSHDIIKIPAEDAGGWKS